MTSDKRRPQEGVEEAEGWEAASLAEVAHASSDTSNNADGLFDVPGTDAPVPKAT